MRIVHSSTKEILVAFASKNGEEVEINFDVTGGESDLAPLFSGPLWSAIIWENSVQVASMFIESNPDLFSNKTVVELGCGLGIPGLCTAITSTPNKVFLTDREEDLKVLKGAHAKNKTGFDRVEILPYDWSVPAPETIRHRADVLLAIECVSADVYGRESLDWLLSTVRSTSHSGTRLILCSARRKDDGLDYVLDKLLGLSTEVKCHIVVEETHVELYEVILK
jgi:predicted nicotinamide N-methyase